MKRLVHYAAATSKGMVFSCFIREQHAAWPRETHSYEQMRAARKAKTLPPPPQYSTNLEKVTCPECWAEIAIMARERAAFYPRRAAAVKGE